VAIERGSPDAAFGESRHVLCPSNKQDCTPLLFEPNLDALAPFSWYLTSVALVLMPVIVCSPPPGNMEN